MRPIALLVMSIGLTVRAVAQLPSTYACLPGTPHHGAVTGTVTRAESGRVAAHVMVELHDSARVCRTRTDLHGQFAFEPGRSTWTLTISNPGDQQFLRDGLRVRGGEHLTVNPRLRPLVLTLDECALLARCSELLAAHRDPAVDRDDRLLLAAARTSLALADVRHHPDWRACVNWSSVDQRRTAQLTALLNAEVIQAGDTRACGVATSTQPVLVKLAVTLDSRSDRSASVMLRLHAAPDWTERWTCQFSAGDVGWQAQVCRRDSDPTARE